MGLAVLIDLYRIANSLGAFTTTMGRLTPGQTHESSYEFIYYYFPINIVAIVVALLASWKTFRCSSRHRSRGARSPCSHCGIILSDINHRADISYPSTPAEAPRGFPGTPCGPVRRPPRRVADGVWCLDGHDTAGCG